MKISKPTKEVCQAFGNNLKLRRKELHMTQEVFADRLGLSVNYISGLERGTRLPSMPVFMKMLEILDTSPNALLNFSKDGKIIHDANMEIYSVKLMDIGISLSQLSTKDQERAMELIEAVLDTFSK